MKADRALWERSQNSNLSVLFWNHSEHQDHSSANRNWLGLVSLQMIFGIGVESERLQTQWLIYSTFQMRVYFCLDSAVLPLSVCLCLYHNKERAHWAVHGDCKSSIANVAQQHKHAALSMLHILHGRPPSSGGEPARSPGLFGPHRGCYLDTVRNGVSVGLLPACSAVTCSPGSPVSGRLSEQVETICQRSYLRVFSGPDIWAFAHNLEAFSNDSGIWQLAGLFIALMLQRLRGFAHLLLPRWQSQRLFFPTNHGLF